MCCFTQLLDSSVHIAGWQWEYQQQFFRHKNSLRCVEPSKETTLAAPTFVSWLNPYMTKNAAVVTQENLAQKQKGKKYEKKLWCNCLELVSHDQLPMTHVEGRPLIAVIWGQPSYRPGWLEAREWWTVTPKVLIIPGHIGVWAHHGYVPTQRGIAGL